MANFYKNAKNGWKIFFAILLGFFIAGCAFALVVLIGCAVNGVGFNQQIVNWFSAPEIESSAKILFHIL